MVAYAVQATATEGICMLIEEDQGAPGQRPIKVQQAKNMTPTALFHGKH